MPRVSPLQPFYYEIYRMRQNGVTLQKISQYINGKYRQKTHPNTIKVFLESRTKKGLIPQPPSHAKKITKFHNEAVNELGSDDSAQKFLDFYYVKERALKEKRKKEKKEKARLEKELENIERQKLETWNNTVSEIKKTGSLITDSFSNSISAIKETGSRVIQSHDKVIQSNDETKEFIKSDNDSLINSFQDVVESEDDEPVYSFRSILDEKRKEGSRPKSRESLTGKF